MSDLAGVVVFAMPPLWFPLLRLAISLFMSSKIPKAAAWCYGISFIWVVGWFLFQWVIKVPSGVGYAAALMTAWPALIVGLIAEMVAMVRRKR